MEDGFLGVDRSLTGKRWQAKPYDQRLGLAISQRSRLPEVVGRVMASRGVGLDEAERFLNPTLRDLLPDPSHLKGMEEGCERLAGAVMQGERIAVFGDYDVDGATSSALLTRFLRAVGAKTRVYIPDRIKEGYGPNETALLKLKEEGCSLVVTLDCGTLAHAPLGVAARAGLDVIVVDHHEAEASLPAAVAVINPNRLDEDSPHGHMAAVGVAFLLVVGLNRTLRGAGWYAGRKEPNLTRWLDLVALGTVCDVVPLRGINRALVRQGLKVMAGRENPGLRALIDVAGIDEAPNAYHAGFILGPRINAGGRVGASDLGATLLCEDDPGRAGEIARYLDTLNRERQDIESRVLEDALAGIEASGAAEAPLILALGEGWHPGVIGIVAARIKEKFNRPACVVSLDGEKGVGSGRSITGVDLGAMIIAARQAGILIKGGGHAMAAGFTVERERIEELRLFLNERAGDFLAGLPTVPSLYLDGCVTVGAANMGLISSLRRLEPFGSGNPEPRFAISSARLAVADVVGRDQSHLRCVLEGEDGRRLNAIAFRCMDTEMGKALRHHDGAPFHIAGRLRENVWQGRSSVQLMIDDAAPVW